ncbi:MAG: hypothetical protein M1272_08525 [Firmicutes bacterium]|nr:hypothetical protein [Bacillota bacterium]
MPIGPLPPGCIAICASEASDVTQDIPIVSGVVQFSSDGVTLSNVVVNGCAVTDVFFTEVSSRAVGITVAVALDIAFEGTIDGFTFHGTTTIEGDIFFTEVLLPTHGATLVSPPDCAGNFTCTARYAGVDPTSGLQQFTVHLVGDVTCVACSPVPYVVVQSCLPAVK